MDEVEIMIAVMDAAAIVTAVSGDNLNPTVFCR